MIRRHLRMSMAIIFCLSVMVLETTVVYYDGWFVLKTIGVLLAISAVGFGMRVLFRSWNRFALGVWFTQALVGLVLAGLLFGSSVVRGPGAIVQEAWVAIRDGNAPVHNSPALALCILVAFITLTLLIDLCVFATREAGLTIIPIATWFTVVASVPLVDMPFHGFIAAALGYAAILLAESFNRVESWPRHLAASDQVRTDTPSTLWSVAFFITIPSIALALLAAPFVPVQPEAPPPSARTLPKDPQLDLAKNLKDTTPTEELLTYKTSATGSTGGVYLRLATLPTFGRKGWSPALLDAQSLPDGNFELGHVPGLMTTAGPVRSTDIRTLRMSGTYLPLPYAPRKVSELSKSWQYDPLTMAVLAANTDDPSSTQSLTYKVESLDIMPTAEQLQTAAPGRPSEETASLPEDLNPEIRALTTRVTANARTPLEKAAAIQEFLRSKEFVYDLDAGPNSRGPNAIEEFLLKDRRGYCEQFAGAMGVMARLSGFSSRLVIGFLPSKVEKDGFYSITNKNMHAWTELYFDQWGWVRFEPTPGQVSSEPPPYTKAVNLNKPSPSPTPSTSTSPTPSTTPSAVPTTLNRPITSLNEYDGQIWRWVGGSLLALIGLGAVLGTPAMLRWGRRRRRLTAPADVAVEAAWAEIRDTALDVAMPWPAQTPRQLLASFEPALSPAARAAFTEIALAVERERFAEHPGKLPLDLDGKVDAIRAELLAGSSPRQRMLARFLPVSLLRRG